MNRHIFTVNPIQKKVDDLKYDYDWEINAYGYETDRAMKIKKELDICYGLLSQNILESIVNALKKSFKERL